MSHPFGLPDPDQRIPMLTHMLACLEDTDPRDWQDMLEQASADLGGSLTPANPRAGWGPHFWELSLLGILGTGDTLDAAARDWGKCARRTINPRPTGVAA